MTFRCIVTNPKVALFGIDLKLTVTHKPLSLSLFNEFEIIGSAATIVIMPDIYFWAP